MPDAFGEHIEQIVSGFLQSVVVVDDEALRERQHDGKSGRSERPAAAEKEDGAGGGQRGVQELIIAGDPESAPATGEEAEGEEHDLDPKALADAFAAQGLVCAVLSPAYGEEIGGKVLTAARRADLVVLDWVLNGDHGGITLRLIRAILDADTGDKRRRLRTIAVYTGQPTLANVADQVADALRDAYVDCELEREEGAMDMTLGPVRVAVFAKAAATLPDQLQDRRVGIAELPGRLRQEFATLTRGLVPAVAMAALGALREDTHRILDALNPKLDASYLGHRIGQSTAADSEEDLAALAAGEIFSVLGDNAIGETAALEPIKAWLTDRRAGGVEFGVAAGRALSDDDVMQIVEHGIKSDSSKQYFHGKINPDVLAGLAKRGVRVFSATVEDAEDSEAQFSQRSALRTHYRRPARALRLGTILLGPEGWLICVQPLCDSIRINPDEERGFPMLRAGETDVNGPKRFAVKHPGEDRFVWLASKPQPQDIVTIAFAATDHGQVFAHEAGEQWQFDAAGGGTLTWAAELKPEYGQQVAVELAQQFSRVGLNELETMRLARRG